MEFLKFLEGIRLPFLDRFFQWCTYLGQDIPILVIICILFWCVSKTLAYQIGLSFFSAGLLLQNLKITFRIDRPWILDPSLHPVASAVPAATGYSFPSGHTQGAASLFSTLGLNTRNRAAQILFTLIFCTVGFSRMYLGVHTPKDVLAAIGISLIGSFGVHRLFGSLKDDWKSNGLVGLVMGLCSIFTICYALFLLDSQTISADYAADCCKAGGAGLGFSLGWYLERTWVRFDPSGKLPFQVLKCLLGLLAALALKAGMKKILGDGIPAEILQYFLLVLWILVLYPAIFQRFGSSHISHVKQSQGSGA